MQNSVWSRFQVPFFPPSPPPPLSPPFFVVYTRVKMLSSVSSPLKSLFRACQWFEGAKLQLEITDIHSFLCCLYLEGFRIPPASRAHPVYDCKNRMWKFMEDVEDDDVWLKVVQSVSFLSPSFFLMRDSSMTFDIDPSKILFLSRYRWRNRDNVSFLICFKGYY